MSLEREFIDSYGEFINDELINVWENGYCGYWIPNKDDIVLNVDYNTLFNSKVKDFLNNNKWELKDV